MYSGGSGLRHRRMKGTVWFLTWSLVAFLNIKNSKGIKCWTCDGKNSLKECHGQYGAMQECSQADHVCQNDYRTVRGKPLIIKGCKQAEACETEVKQNANNNQCGRTRSKKNLVCRCCCSTSGCNSKASGCLPPPAPCKRLQKIKNGRTYCPTGEINFGSQCSFSCQNGYELVGKKKAVCRPIKKGSKKGRWNPEDLPFCKKIIVQCEPPREAPTNGGILCKNSPEYSKFEGFNYAGSTCKYSCKKNYYVSGSKITQCGMNRKWNKEPPVCKMGSCDAGKNDTNRITVCTNGNFFGSSCKFSCKEGFNLIGYKVSTCAQMGDGEEGAWTKNFPRCAKVVCFPAHTKLLNGKVACTDQNFKDSECTFTCNNGFDMVKTTKPFKKIVCQDGKSGDTAGKWSGSPPTCAPMSCKPALSDPQNGQVLCTDKNNFGSVCTFSCADGYDLDGTEKETTDSVCGDDGNGDDVGEWSANPATCTPITCDPSPKAPEDGRIQCTNRNFLGSVCSYECLDDFDLKGTKELVVTRSCNAGENGVSKGKWSSPPPVCDMIICPTLPEFENGMRICSLWTFYSGTFCLLRCYDGYDMTGITYISCSNSKKDGDLVGDWSAPQASCELGRCEQPKYDTRTVVQKCTAPSGFAVDEYRVGTLCEYKCKDDGYYLVPNTGTVAILDGFLKDRCSENKKWSKRPPRCIPKTCLPVVSTIENGHTPKCTDNNNYDSVCKFQCLAKHGLTHDRPLVCQGDGDNDEYGKWSDEVPKCIRNECDEFGTITNGRLNCTNGIQVGSVCTLECIDKYITKRYDQVTCLPSAEWNRKKYVCCVRCLFNKRLNMFALFDSTSFTTKNEWQYIVDFIQQAISRMVRFGLDIQFGAVHYAESVDTESEVTKARLRREEDLTTIAAQIKSMPFSGRVANTGEALAYANDVFFKRTDRRREEFVLLITSGNSNDEVTAQAKAIRERGINILVVAFKTNQSAQKVMLDIAGVERNLLSADSLDDLVRLSEEISLILMSTGCTLASKSQSCS